MGFVFAAAVIVALSVGFVAGLVVFKVKLRWCPACGSALRCTACAGHPTPRDIRESVRQAGRP